MVWFSMQQLQYSQKTVAGLLALGLSLSVPAGFTQAPGLPPANVPSAYGEEEASPAEYYTTYAEQAMEAYRKGESTRAIDLMTKAFKLAPTNTAVINNLAASYIQRGVYMQNTKKDFAKAISDYRQALFLLAHEWPAEVQQTGTSMENIKILQDNLEGAMKNAGMNTSDWNAHLKSAWELRRKGNLPEAMVEYAWVTTLNPKHSDSWAAQGDIYTVRQKPEKAAVAYQKAVDTASAPSDSLYVKLGTALLQTRSPEKAVEHYNKALAINPKNKDALLSLEQVWNQEIKANPRNMSAHLNLGAVYQQLGRYDDAHAQYQISDRLSPNNLLIKLNLGSLHQAKGQLNEALGMYDAVLQTNPGHAKALLYKADVLKQIGRTQESEGVLQQALHSSPDKQQILDQLIAVYKAEGNPAKLRSGWELYAKTFPQNASVQYQAGLSLHEAKDYEGAIAYYQKAINLKPDMAEAYANMGTAMHAVNKDDEAVKTLEKALKLNPDLEEVKTLLAALEQHKGTQALVDAAKLHQEGNYAEAVRGYEAVLKQDPNNPDVNARYGLALQALKRYPQAIAAYDKALTKSPDSAQYYYYKATALDEQNQLDAAQKHYEKALALDPNLTQAKEALEALKSSTIDNKLAQALEAFNRQQYAKTIQLSDEALKANPSSAMAYYYKGLAYDAQKKLEPAKIAYEKAVALDNQLADAVYALAVVLDTQGKKDDAKKAYQQFVNLMKDQPEDDFIKYAKERISSL